MILSIFKKNITTDIATSDIQPYLFDNKSSNITAAKLYRIYYINRSDEYENNYELVIDTKEKTFYIVKDDQGMRDRYEDSKKSKSWLAIFEQYLLLSVFLENFEEFINEYEPRSPI